MPARAAPPWPRAGRRRAGCRRRAPAASPRGCRRRDGGSSTPPWRRFVEVRGRTAGGRTCAVLTLLGGRAEQVADVDVDRAEREPRASICEARRSWVDSVTVCPASVRRRARPVCGAMSPHDPAEMISTSMSRSPPCRQRGPHYRPRGSIVRRRVRAAPIAGGGPYPDRKDRDLPNAQHRSRRTGTLGRAGALRGDPAPAGPSAARRATRRGGHGDSRARAGGAAVGGPGGRWRRGRSSRC